MSGRINFSTNTIKDINFLDKVKFNILLEEGDIFIQNLKTTFKDSVIINLKDTQLIVDDNKLKFAGYILWILLMLIVFIRIIRLAGLTEKILKILTLRFYLILMIKL